MVRAFVAIDLSPEIREGIAQVQEVLARCDARMTLVAPKNMHITLKFIGEVSQETLDQIQAALGRLAFEPFEINLHGVAANNPRRPRVIWASGSDGGKSAALHRNIEDLIAPFGIEREKRSFTPHATIALLSCCPVLALLCHSPGA